jgi:catechol 2,3-dioxygenase-like lactoylglutathione lyase family enzyme
METIIDDLVCRFQDGGLTRRQLVRGLSLLVAAAAAPSAGAAQTGGLRGTGVDHVSILVSDLQRSATFYRDLFGMSVVSEDKPNQILRLGADRTIVSLRHEGQPGTVDHFAIRVENFNRESATRELKQHGMTPQENVQFGFYIKDPDGVIVQIV